MEEEFWREKSRIKWQVNGDRNSRFFQTYAKIIRKTNIISSLVIDNEVVTHQNKLKHHIVNHFKMLFNNNVVLQENQLISSVIPSLVTNQINELLTMLPSAYEIHKDVQNLKVDYAPGPDGFGGFF